MNPPDLPRLLETLHRRELTPAEQSHLAAWASRHPEVAAQLREEAALTRLLGSLPPAELSPDLAARVLAVVDRKAALRAAPRISWPERLRTLLPRWQIAGAMAGAALALTLITVQHRAAERARLAESVAALSALAELPGLEALAEFDLVYSLPPNPLPEAGGLAQALE